MAKQKKESPKFVVVDVYVGSIVGGKIDKKNAVLRRSGVKYTQKYVDSINDSSSTEFCVPTGKKP